MLLLQLFLCHTMFQNCTVWFLQLYTFYCKLSSVSTYHKMHYFFLVLHVTSWTTSFSGQCVATRLWKIVLLCLFLSASFLSFSYCHVYLWIYFYNFDLYCKALFPLILYFHIFQVEDNAFFELDDIFFGTWTIWSIWNNMMKHRHNFSLMI